MFSVMSRIKLTLRAEAWSGVNGGVSRVFTLPGRGALAITARAQQPSLTSAASPGCNPLYGKASAAPVTHGVLIPVILPRADCAPGLGGDQGLKFVPVQHGCAAGFVE